MSLIYTFLFYELAELAALMRMIKFERDGFSTETQRRKLLQFQITDWAKRRFMLHILAAAMETSSRIVAYPPEGSI